MTSSRLKTQKHRSSVVNRERTTVKGGGREGKGTVMEIVWQTPANPPEPQDYIFRDGEMNLSVITFI